MTVSVVERTAQGGARRLLVLLPGYGDEPTVFTDHLAAIDPQGEWQVAVVRPPIATPEGPAWFRVDDDGPVADDITAAIEHLCTTCTEAIDRLGLDPDDIVLAGYSQGGAMALATATDPSIPVRPGAVAALAAYLPHRAADQDATLLAGRPVLVAHGADDEIVDALLGRSAAKVLDRAGAQVTWAEVDGGHTLHPHLLGALRAWLDALPAPAAP